VNRLGRIARLHHQPEACVQIINTQYGFNAMEVQEAFVKASCRCTAVLLVLCCWCCAAADALLLMLCCSLMLRCWCCIAALRLQGYLLPHRGGAAP
jgi:hypothetical protein